MKSILVANSKGGCGTTFISYLMANYLKLHYISNTEPKMDFRSLDVFSSSLEAVDLCTYFAQQCIGSHIITNANATLLA